jgi:hypothetical protein
MNHHGLKLFLSRVLRSAVPTMIGLAVLGYLFSQAAGFWHSRTERGEIRDHVSGEISESLSLRLPVTMACWGLVIVLVAEGLRFIWMPRPPKLLNPARHSAADEAAIVLLEQLLLEAELAIQLREHGSVTETPLPRTGTGEELVTLRPVPAVHEKTGA